MWSCKVACPFGCYIEQSFIVQIIQNIKAGKRVYAVFGTAFIGQFGTNVTPVKSLSALQQIGFHDIWEASWG